MRRLAIGDIHGDLDALLSVLEQVNYDPADDQLFFLGDYIDRHNHSKEVVDLILNLRNTVCLLGNHDQFMIDYLNQDITEKSISDFWWEHGGNATLDSYGIESKYTDNRRFSVNGEIPNEHKRFFLSLESYHITKDNHALVHGGFDLQLKDMSAQYVMWDRNMWKTAKQNHPHGSASYPCFYEFDKIFIGHTNLLDYNEQRECFPVKRLNVWNIDTGAGFSGPLTIMDMDTEEYWQSKRKS